MQLVGKFAGHDFERGMSGFLDSFCVHLIFAFMDGLWDLSWSVAPAFLRIDDWMIYGKGIKMVFGQFHHRWVVDYGGATVN